MLGAWLSRARVAAGVVGRALLVAVVRQRGPSTAAASVRRRSLERDLREATRGELTARVMTRLATTILGARGRSEIEEALSEILGPARLAQLAIFRNASDPGLGLVARAVAAAGAPTRAVAWRDHAEAVSLLRGGEMSWMPHRGHPASVVSLAIPISVDGVWMGHISATPVESDRSWDGDELEALVALAQMVSSSWAQERAVEDLAEVLADRDAAIDRQRALHEVAHLMIAGKSPGDLDRALEEVLRATSTTVAYVRKVDHDPVGGEGLITVTATGAETVPFLGHLQWAPWPPGFGPVRAGRPLVIRDTALLTGELHAWYAANAGDLGSELAVPVAAGGQIVGVLGVGSAAARGWSSADIETLTTVAQLMGAAWTRERARRALEDLVDTKDRFIASVSHELRTPIAVVLGLSAELDARRNDFSEGEISEFIDLIARQSREVAGIIEDLLVSARISSGTITMLPELMRLDDTVRETLDELSTDHTSRIRTLELDPVSTFADPLRVRQIIRNLLANGHRHGGEEVSVRVREEDGAAVFEVADNGPGIPPDLQERIFAPYAVGTVLSGQPTTIGLGLTVSRQLARLMGGEVSYRPDPEPTFRLLLPVGAAVPSEASSSPGRAAMRD